MKDEELSRCIHGVWENLRGEFRQMGYADPDLEADEPEWFDTDDGSFTRRGLERTGHRVVEVPSRVEAVHRKLTSGRG